MIQWAPATDPERGLVCMTAGIIKKNVGLKISPPGSPVSAIAYHESAT
jgi:hypothetical protein